MGKEFLASEKRSVKNLGIYLFVEVIKFKKTATSRSSSRQSHPVAHGGMSCG